MPDKKANVILVITDDQGYGDLGCHGNPIISTPNIDNLYNQSVRFTNFHVGPTCAPTRAGLMTGRYCNCTGVWHTIGGRSLLRQDEVTIADVFKANDYRTGMFGKWHLGDNYPFRPHDRGFEVALYHGGGGVSQTPDYWGNDYFDDTYMLNGEPVSFQGYCTDVWFREAMKFVESNKDNPLFCYISTNAPHAPYNVDKSYSDLYKGKIPDYRADFYGMITCIDDNVGRLMAKLNELGIEDNTILIWMTDNGSAAGASLDKDGFVQEGYNAGMRGMKGWEYDGGHHVPFFIKWHELPKGSDIDQISANIDVLPTLIDLCGLETSASANFNGISLKPLLYGGELPDRVIITDSQRVEYPIKWRKSAVMTDQWRLINGIELYDAKIDPEQRNNLAGKHPDIVQELKSHYESWWNLVSPTFDKECPIIIGSELEPISRLTTHDWHGEQCAWNQGLVREGLVCNGYWVIEVAKDGKYSFELCRWCKEEDRSMTEGIPGDIKDWYHGGKALNLKEARIRVGNQEQTKSIDTHAKGVEFIFGLKAGITDIQTFLSDDKGVDIGAYYVYAKKLD